MIEFIKNLFRKTKPEEQKPEQFEEENIERAFSETQEFGAKARADLEEANTRLANIVADIKKRELNEH